MWHLWPSGGIDRVDQALSGATPGDDLIGIGLDLDPSTLLEAYRRGLFPMGIGRHGRRPMGWWSPDPRGVLRPGALRVSRSLRKSARRFEVTVDVDFPGVLAACADPRRSGRWITAEVAAAYERLHRAGHAHSVEVWQSGELVGGLYGVGIGGLFAGESMFHTATDASKVALWALTQVVFRDGDPRRLIDVQWATPHLTSLGVEEVPRSHYLTAVASATSLMAPDFARPEITLVGMPADMPPEGVNTRPEPGARDIAGQR